MTFEVNSVRSSRPRPSQPQDIPIKLGEDEIGCLCLLRGLTGEISAFTDAQKAAFEFETSDVQLGSSTYTFRADYVVILKSRWADYGAMKSCSSFWGEYLHEDEAPSESVQQFNGNEIISVDRLCRIPTRRHAESMAKYASYGRPTDRFLFLYHFLELDFDREVVRRIKSLDENNLQGVGKIIRDLGVGDEMSRLVHVLREMPVLDICAAANALKLHGPIAKEIFYEHGKDGNPIKEYADFVSYFLETSAVNEFLISEQKRHKKISLDLSKDFATSMRKCAAYWVYRVRCCVAHNKLGEYHLTSAEDMEFVEGFALPLLKCMVGFRMKQVQ